MGGSVKLSESLEDYLEAIYHLVTKGQVARSRDIANRLGVGRSSVTGALQALSEKGLVNYEPYETIPLTRRGRAAARQVVRRHEAMRDFLVKVLSVDEDEANEAACRMEHATSPAILERLVAFVVFLEKCPRFGPEWIKGLGYSCGLQASDKCEQCIASCLEELAKRKARVADENVGSGHGDADDR